MKKIYHCCMTNQPTGELHHIFPGRGKRKVCETYSIKIPVASPIHEFAHGRSLQALHLIDRFFDHEITRNGIQTTMARKFCEIVGIDYDETILILNYYFDPLKKPMAHKYLLGVQRKCQQYLVSREQ